ncbi:hypothetical protein ACIP79_18625 [Streptomyces sp. NPDC088747]|uniref:hypothetical protein n=1 Tax=Streptomyces sp. NPDC088747 TaxID=3365886 RepID=UPI003805195A
MGAVLVVPVHLDALVLDRDRDVTAPTVDFTGLPHVDPVSGRDHGPDVPYLGEALLSVPFQDQTFRLRAGVHLHWALPNALTGLDHRRADERTGAPLAPAVPNRWLVTRSRGGAVERQWVVESDYCATGDTGGVPYPCIEGEVPGPAGPPFRRLGRRVPLQVWEPSADGGEDAPYLRRLTATGYGEPAFATFYPHCHSVFGLHDPEPAGGPAAEPRYDVVGWYADLAQDAAVAELRRVGGDSGVPWPQVLSKALGWDTAADGRGTGPDRTVCVGRLDLVQDRTAGPEGAPGEPVTVCVGSTPTEALAAHLGDVLPGASRDGLEDLLEALAFADDLESAPLDVGTKLAEARHAGTFRTLPSGQVWTVRPKDRPAASAQDDPPGLEGLAHRVGDLLDALNGAQGAYDRAVRDLTGMREELFADWCRYLVCAYPPETRPDSYPSPDLAAFHLRRQAARIERRRVAVESTLADAVRDAEAVLVAALDGDLYEPARVPGPSYYEPLEPVVLLSGAAATPSERYGQGDSLDPAGRVDCVLVGVDDATVALDRTDAPRALRDAVLDAVGPRTWERQPWHPLYLHWQVEFFPVARGGNVSADSGSGRDYAADYVTGSHTLDRSEVELVPVPGRAAFVNAANVYTGSTVLSPAARPVLSARILRYLEKPLLLARNDGAEESARVTPERYREDPEPVLDWYRENGEDTRLRTLVDAQRHLARHEQANLAQSLGGFNDALLMRRLTRQLPIADPLGFPGSQELARVVDAVVGDATRLSPQPLSGFNPIRAGALKLLRLRVVDTFGQVRDIALDEDRVRTTTRLRVPDHPDWVALPPRLTQPARLSLRWLDAGGDADDVLRETNVVPSTSPVCGWLLPNHLDGGLAVHAADGRALGTLLALPDLGDADLAQWHPAPGRPATAVDEIPNLRLRTVVRHLRDLGAGGVRDLLGTLDDALAAIEPEDYALHRSRALLVSRPVAVVRAAVGLELMGLPAAHQDWNVFRQDLRRGGHETDGFTRTRFPVRVGDHGRLGDAVAAYWVEPAPGELPEGPPLSPLTAPPLLRTVDAPPQSLTLLVDPRGAVHACCGALPAKSVSLPEAHYRAALERMETWFLNAPVLTEAESVEVPLPQEPGFLWSWTEATPAGWTETSTTPTVRRADVLAAVADVPGTGDTWAALVRLGWITPLDGDTATVTPAEARADPGTDLPLDVVAPLAGLLDRPGLANARLEARFPDRPTAREGWLTLRPLPPSTPAPAPAGPPTAPSQ